MSLKISELGTNAELLALKRRVTQEHINCYASASGDFNPIHVNPEFAKKTQFGGTVAHGMLILAYLFEFMTNNFGKQWLNSGSLNARFKGAAYPQDTITITGKVTSIEKEGNLIIVECEVLCYNQKNEPIIKCTTKVKGKNDEDS